VLLVAAALLLAPAAGLAQKVPPSLLRQEAALKLPQAAGAVAISADESMLAAALPAGRGRWRVQLYDRPSHGRLGLIEAKVGADPRLRFSPVSDLLLVAGSDALQLWELPIGPMEPNKPLGPEHRRWEVKLSEPAGQVRFGTPPDMVYWSKGAALYRRSVQTGVPFDGKPLWEPLHDSQPITDFAFDPQSALLALVYRQSKAIGLLDLNHAQLLRSLQGHRFPVVAARFSDQRPLLSLDAGNDLIQWQNHAQPVATMFLDQVPSDFHAAGFTALGDHHLLLEARDGRALAIEERTARPVAELRADGPQRIAVSPTGRYVLAAEGQMLRIYGFAQPSSPLAYVRHLRRLKAYDMAQSYVRLMDDRGISPQLRADLLNEASREPPGQELQAALARMKEAVQESDADRIRYWAEQVLSLQPGQPDASAALRALREQQDARTLDQARDAYQVGQYRVAISLLSNQIQDDSRFYPDALELIRQAEARRSVETALIQAREKLNLSDFPAAEALVQEALRKEPGNRAAQALQDEIDDRSGATERQIKAALIGLSIASLLVGFVAMRYRRRLGPLMRKLRLDEQDERSGPFARGAARPHAEPHRAAEPRQPEPERPPPRPHAATAARRKVIEALIKETDERIQRLRMADHYGQHTARLMELEAELNAIQRRLVDPSVELGPLHNRLRAIDAQVRSLRIEPRRGPQQEERQRHAGQAGTGQAALPGGQNGEPTHYEVLELTPEASLEQIKAAYHKLLKQYHPDLHNASQFAWVRAESERMSRRIALAYQVLSDDAARARYDHELRNRKGPGR